MSSQHAHNEEVIAQLEQRKAQVEELTACVTKQHADNEQMIGRLKQHEEQLQDKDRLVLQIEQQQARTNELWRNAYRN